jgi:hypothetical protein
LLRLPLALTRPWLLSLTRWLALSWLLTYTGLLTILSRLRPPLPLAMAGLSGLLAVFARLLPILVRLLSRLIALGLLR